MQSKRQERRVEEADRPGTYRLYRPVGDAGTRPTRCSARSTTSGPWPRGRRTRRIGGRHEPKRRRLRRYCPHQTAPRQATRPPLTRRGTGQDQRPCPPRPRGGRHEQRKIPAGRATRPAGSHGPADLESRGRPHPSDAVLQQGTCAPSLSTFDDEGRRACQLRGNAEKSTRSILRARRSLRTRCRHIRVARSQPPRRIEYG